jgi:putative ABC transport system permease protein
VETNDITIINLLLGLLLVFIPAIILAHYKTGITKAMFIAVARMVIQLFCVGFYLNYLFEWNSAWINILWLLVMTGVCAIDLLKRVRIISIKTLFFPIFLAILFSLCFVAFYFLQVVLVLDNLFESRYFIPICGILLGNILSSNVIGLNAFYSQIEREQQFYNYLLCNGATISEATRPFIREALIKSFNPMIAGIAVMGLISLPGTLIGQIMGGSEPTLAIRYQIMMMVIVMSSGIISLLLSLHWSIKRTFDEFGKFKI